MAIERIYFITMHDQAGVNFENLTEVKFRDILLTGTGQRDRHLNWDSPGQTGTYGRSTLKVIPSTRGGSRQQVQGGDFSNMWQSSLVTGSLLYTER